MAGNVILVGDDYEILMELAVGLRGTPYAVTVAESARPLARALQLVAHWPRAMLVMLDGLETVVDVRALLLSSPETRFVFVVQQMPPRATLARVVREHGGMILSRRDAPIVVVATLVALLAETPAAGRPSGAL
jgi:CheY-like chemotaxis protein